MWDGTPDTGTLVAEFSSDGDTLPHLVMPPGTGGVLLQVSIDPGDPNQIFISGASGTNTLSVGFRIDQHNAPGTPCILPPPANQNAFPNTDFGGLEAPTQNWIFAVDGIQCVCGAGWLTFEQLPFDCTPTGDWVLRATYSCTAEPVFGACCDLTDGSCLDGESSMTEEACASLGGEFEGEGTECDNIECPQPTAACCFLPNGCVNLDEDNCALADGFWQGLGTTCDEIDCFAIGACCDPLGACTDDTSPDDCAALGGEFQGTNTVCDDTVCPAPIGGCCLANGSCLELIEDDCGQIPGSDWSGALTNCDDVNENGTADACEALSILSSIPPNQAIDARQPFEPDGSNPDGWSSIEIEMTQDASGLTATDFTVVQLPGGEAPGIAGITIDGNTVVLEFTATIHVGAWTVIRHVESDTTTQMGYLPADVNNDRTSGANDVLYLVDVLNGVVDPAPATYQTDIDRSDAVNANDILRVIDLLNGAGQYDAWIGATLP